MAAKSHELVAEFIGTYVLVLTVGCNVLGGSGLWAVTSIAFSLMVMIYALGNVSGANFNPAVSVTLALTNNMEWAKCGLYCVAQILGGLLGGATYALLFGEAFNLEPGQGYHWSAAAEAEIVYTFFLTFTVLCTAVLKGAAEKEFFGYAIASTVIAGGYAAGAVSGGCFNPAVAIGVDTASAGLGFGWSLAYTGFELIGAALAAIFFKFTFPVQFGKEKSGSEVYLAEFIGTFFLCITVLFAVGTGAPAAALSIGAALAVAVYNTYTESADLNPAVTLSALTANLIKGNKTDAGKTAVMLLSQLAGGLMAAAAFSGVVGAGKVGSVGPGANFALKDALAAEFVFTFVLCSVVLNIVEQLPALIPALGLSVGGVIVAGGNAVGKVSGAAFNPAVAVAVQAAAKLNSAEGWANVGMYSAVQVLGGVAAAGAMAAMRSDSFAAKK